MSKRYERILIYGIMAVMGAIGGIAFFCALAGIETARLGGTAALGMTGGLFGLLFSVFLFLDLWRETD